jgi:tRNA G10  N-methylase Trm11
MPFYTSIFNNQHDAIKAILDLHCKTPIELDPTYSKGGFYKNGIKEPKWRYDIAPQRPGVTQADATNLPLEDACINTMIVDPPFLATKGPSINEDDPDVNQTIKRFGHYPTEAELFSFYYNLIIEAHRLLVKDGILIFKCQDKVSSGKQYMSHVEIINYAERCGFYTKDLAIVLAKHRMIPEWQRKNQKHFRKFHAYFIVFQKKNVNLNI